MSQRFTGWKPLNLGPGVRSAAYSRASLKGTLASQGVVTGGRSASSSFQAASHRLPDAAPFRHREAVITAWIRRQRNLPPYFKPDPSPVAPLAAALLVPAHENGRASLSSGAAPAIPSLQTMGKKPPKSDKPAIRIPGLTPSIPPSFNPLELKRAEVRAAWAKIREEHSDIEIQDTRSLDERIRKAASINELNRLQDILQPLMQKFRKKRSESQNTDRMRNHLFAVAHDAKELGLEEFAQSAERALSSFESADSYLGKRTTYRRALAIMNQLMRDLWETNRQTQALVRKMNLFLQDPAAPDEVFAIADDFKQATALPRSERFTQRKRLTALAEAVYTAEKSAGRQAVSVLQILEGLAAKVAGSVSANALDDAKRLLEARRAREALPLLLENLATAREIRDLSDFYREAIAAKLQNIRDLCVHYPDLADTVLQAEALLASPLTLPEALNALWSLEEALHVRIGAIHASAPAPKQATDPIPSISIYAWHERETPDELQPEFFEWGTIRIEASRFKSVAKFYAEIQPAHQSAFWRRLNELDQSEGMPSGSANWETLSGHPNLLSAEVTNGIRLIIRKKGANFLIEDLGPHDAVYARLPKPKK